jgi:hypothetical protein
MNHRHRRVQKLVAIIAAVLVLLCLGYYHADPFRIPFTGLDKVERVDGAFCGSEWVIAAFEFRVANVQNWVKTQNEAGGKWVRGPLQGAKEEQALEWITSSNDLNEPEIAEVYPWHKWVESKDAYFLLHRYRASGTHIRSAGIWVLDADAMRLYHLTYRE